MSGTVSRREVLHDLLAAGIVIGTGWPALAQGEQVVPFTDLPPPQPNARVPPSLQNYFTDNDLFFAVQHYPVPPAIEPSAYTLRVTGLVDRPLELTHAELRSRPRLEEVVGFECSGNNNARGNPLIGNARWSGTSLARVLRDAGVRPTAREVVFFGADKATEEIAHGGPADRYEQYFGRALSIDDAMRPEVMLADEMNGRPMPHAHGAPVRLVVPGWYGVANVKWLNHIHVQDTRFMGRFMARDYVTLRGQQVGDTMVWNETSVGRTRLKSAIGRLTRTGDRFKATGFALTDGTGLRTVEVRVDGGPWTAAALDKRNSRYSWQLFTYEWSGLPPGDHTIVSRATDTRGDVQPTEDDLKNKKTRWENNGQFVRRFTLNL
jgi:DMSO/TMAO reductase YedYZ molybdopterin-dependent catalytic subunit